MDMRIFDRWLVEKGLKDLSPYSTIFEGGFSGVSSLEFEQIEIVKEIIEFTKKHGYKVRLELYKHHKVLDIICEENCKENYYRNNVVISYSTKLKEIVGCDIGDSGEDPKFTEFTRELVAKYIEPIRGEIDKW